MSKYKITVKTAGWEKEEIPDQLFIPRSDSVQKKPDQLEFDPRRFRPVENWRGVPKPSNASGMKVEKKVRESFEVKIFNAL